jgi:hypothetical protein
VDHAIFETIFDPDDTAEKLYDATARLKLAKANLRITALSLIGILVASVICFAVFLRHRLPREAPTQV